MVLPKLQLSCPITILLVRFSLKECSWLFGKFILRTKSNEIHSCLTELSQNYVMQFVIPRRSKKVTAITKLLWIGGFFCYSTPWKSGLWEIMQGKHLRIRICIFWHIFQDNCHVFPWKRISQSLIPIPQSLLDLNLNKRNPVFEFHTNIEVFFNFVLY